MGLIEKDIVQRSLYDRVSGLLESYEWSDCSFSVSGQDIKAHRLILGISSPVFKAMLYGPMSTNEAIPISDIEHDIFQLLIYYIYTDKVGISSIEQAFELLYAAKKYLLDCLTEKCISYIEANLSVDNVISVLNFSEYIQETSLVLFSRKLFCEHAEYLLNENIESINATCLKIVLQSNEINMTEKNLIKFVFKWTNVYCNVNNIPDTFESKRKLLLDCGMLKLLRLSVLSAEEIKEIEDDSYNLLLSSEIETLKMQINDSVDNVNDLNVKNISLNCDEKSRDTLNVRLYICHRSTLRSATPLIIDANNSKVDIRVKADKTIFLNSIGVPTRMSPQINFHSHKAPSYSEEFSVSIARESDKSVIKFTNFMNTVEYDSNVYVIFSEPCVLKKDEWYKISFMWPRNRYYSYRYIVGHRDYVTHQKVKFQFEDLLANNYTDGSFLENLKFSM